ncbi:MAG: TRAP transporter small permease [Calditrichia bacterium]
MKTLLKKIDSSLAVFENGMIILVLSVMVLLSFLQVLLRNFFDTGLLWGDIFLRHLVLWVGFIGASLATRENKHINIDILTRFLPEKLLPAARIVTYLFTAFICVVLAKAAWVFVSYEKEFGTTLFSDIPAWIIQVIIPAGFALMALRFILKILEVFFPVYPEIQSGEKSI